MKILMVCLGNICRSPLAEGILKEKASKAGLKWVIESAGTYGGHAGNLPDSRSIKVAEKNNIDITDQRSRKFRGYDLEEYDIIYAMDLSNERDLLFHAQNETEKLKIKLILNELYPNENKEVPDPYLWESGFDNVFNMLDKACNIIIEKYMK